MSISAASCHTSKTFISALKCQTNEAWDAMLLTRVHEEGESLSEVNISLLHIIRRDIPCDIVPGSPPSHSLNEKLAKGFIHEFVCVEGLRPYRGHRGARAIHG